MSLKTIFQRLQRERLAFASLIFLAFLGLVAALAPWIAPYDPHQQDLMNVLGKPSMAHWLGTDELGRDVLSRIIMGTRVTFQAAIVSILIPIFIGVPIGILSGYFGKVVDDIFMRIVDAITSIPAILLALGITAALGASLWNGLIAIGVVFTPQFARLARGQTLQLRGEAYVEASQISGGGAGWIMIKHVVPNIAPPLIVQASFNLSMAVLIESSLSFLGLGAQDPQVSWGSMIHQGYVMMNINPWMSLYPGVAIMLTVMAGNFLGDGFRVALDPKYKQS